MGEPHARITELSVEGNALMEREAFAEAAAKFQAAIELLPTPAMQWDAATWLYGSLGETKFLQHDFQAAEEDFRIAIQCPGGNENPFLHLRLGECLLTRNEQDQAAHHLTIAYMHEGEEIFADEPDEIWEFVYDTLKLSENTDS